MTRDTTPYAHGDDETQPPPATPGITGVEGLADPFPGEYRLVRRLGQGAFGEVWLADDLSPLTRQVALKFLRLSNSARRRQQALEVLRNEARILGSLRHPNIVPVQAWRQAGDPPVPCLVLQFVAGGSLEAKVQREGPLPWAAAARYIADIADGLSLLHGKGIIHRDVKPANILLDPEADEALLTDFGIAARLADPGTIAGTPRYMAPEAFRGEVSPALDVYALAATLFWLVTRQPPFDGDTVEELTAAARRGLPEGDRRFAPLPRDLERLIRAGLAARPEGRPELAAFVRDLRGALNALLADCLTMPASAPVNLRLLVSRQVDCRTCVPVASSHRQPESILRDLKRVPASPSRVELRTGDRVRLEVVADQAGYVTVFNVGPTGNLNLLYPPSPGQVPPLLPANEVLHILDVELTPPAGNERLFALWTRRPLPLRLEELRSLAEQGELPRSAAYQATRDMVRVQQSVDRLPASDRHAVVLELDHR
jgi:serine/threonine protein kinase